MATTINADNGVSSGSAGLKEVPDASGVLALQTNGTTALTVDASQNVGVGTTSVLGNSTFNALNGVVARTVSGSGISPYLQLYNGSAGTDLKTWRIGGGSSGQWTLETINDAYSSATTRLYIDSNGYAGLNTSTLTNGYGLRIVNSTSECLELSTSDTDATNKTAAIAASRYTNSDIPFTLVRALSSATVSTVSIGGGSGVAAPATQVSIYTDTLSGVAGTGTERVRVDTSGFTQFGSNNVMPYQGAPTSKAAAATLTGAELITGILNTTGTTYTITLPTGTNIEGALTWAGNNVCLDWWVINTASGTITIGANGNTTLGTLTIATGVSAHFRIRRTTTNTFTVYRLS